MSEMSIYQQFIHKTRYARYLPEKKRRETWQETVTRYCDFLKKKVGNVDIDFVEIYNAIYNLEVMPSMRLLMTAGKAAERDNVAAYNCAFVAVNHPRSFDEILYILMCGTGVGYSVELSEVGKLPTIAEEFHDADTTIVVKDSKIGWASAFRQVLANLYNGDVIKWDLSKLRPKGAPLKTFGGRSSGPEPLDKLLKFSVALFKGAAGRKLSRFECHQLLCMIAEIVVVGGVRRSALMCLSDFSDEEIRDCKTNLWYQTADGAWVCKAPHLSLSNNSAVYTRKPSCTDFMEEWKSLILSGSGERGIFNRESIRNTCIEQGRGENFVYGTNPCGEIMLKSEQFCNLTEVVVRPGDTVDDDLQRKVRIAAVIGTIQASFTNFRYIRSSYKKNCEEDALLGVSVTGLADDAWYYSCDPELAEGVRQLKQIVIDTNAHVAKLIGINPSKSVTCIKPSGTVSQLVDSASGRHPRYAPFFIRRVRNSVADPVSAAMMKAGVPYELDLRDSNTVVFSFPMKSPPHSVCNKQVTAIKQLEHWKFWKTNWATHTVSSTIYVKPDEWLHVAAWVYDNWDHITGLSFFPFSEPNIPQLPYEEISEEKYLELFEATKDVVVDWNSVVENQDDTQGPGMLACAGGVCEL